MESVVTRKGQVVIPAKLRGKYKIETGTRVVWIDKGTVIKVVPIPKDPIGALRGCSEGEGLTESLLISRKEDKRLEG